MTLENVNGVFEKVIDHKALIEGEDLPAYWAREQKDGSLIVFLAQSKSKDLGYPVYSGQSYMKESEWNDLTFNYAGNSIVKKIEFKPYQSVALRISTNGDIEFIDINYIPEDPIVREAEPQKTYF